MRTRIAQILQRRITQARAAVREEISASAARGSRYASAMSAEGYAGGFLDCLNDIETMLNGNEPNEFGRTATYWRRPSA